MSSVNDIRTAFLEYFGANGHEIVSSSPLVPQNDPTLMFTNAGMVQFKNLFTGLEDTRLQPRGDLAEMCSRGGKHNDLGNVGYTARHHTFFEMLGNFVRRLFQGKRDRAGLERGDREFGLNKDKLLVTVYHEDDEAAGHWKKIAGLRRRPDHPHRHIRQFLGDGRYRPLRPVLGDLLRSWRPHPGWPARFAGRGWRQVHRDLEPSLHAVRADRRRAYQPLPKPSIDTGMGLERIAAVLQGKHDNYDIDMMRALVEASADVSNTDVDGEKNVSHRVVADHLRATSFLIADGVLPSNEGRGYVLRRIMRRAMRHLHQLGCADPVMFKLVPALVAEMGAQYPELGRAQALIAETLKLETPVQGRQQPWPSPAERGNRGQALRQDPRRPDGFQAL